MPWRRYAGFLIGAATLVGIASLSQYSYLLFHTVVELAGVVVALGMFTLAWNLRRTLDNTYLLVMGVAAFAPATVDLVHTLAYKGMDIFAGYDANLPTQLHIAARYLQAATLLIAPLLIGRKVRVGPLVSAYGIAVVGLLWSVFTGLFPDCYVEGAGLTTFKIVSEYVVAVVMAAGILLLYARRQAMDAGVLRLLMAHAALTVAGGLAFTLYVGVYDFFNLAGHLLRLLGVYVLYLALVQTGLSRPFDLLFRDLKRSEEALAQERNFIAQVLDRAGAPLVVTDVRGHIVRFNRACEELSGYTAGDAAGRVLWELLVPPADRPQAQHSLDQVRASRSEQTCEYHWVTKAGRLRLMAISATPLRGANGVVQYIICTGTDVTEQRRMEQELRDREERLRVMVESVKTGMLLIDRHTCTIVDANPAVSLLVGLPEHHMVGQSCKRFLRCAGAGGECPLEQGAAAATEAVLLTAAGREVPVHRTAAAMTADGREHVLESIIDMTEYKRLEEELRELSMVDELTGLYNRRGFLTLAPREIESAVRVKGGMVLLFIDVQDLKEVNDRYGHAEGDRALTLMARVLREAFREAGLIARVGGDEFAVLVPHFAGTSPTLLVNRLQEHLESYNCAARGAYELRAGIGYARFNPTRPCSAADLLSQADNMLYLERRRRLP